MIPQTGWKAMKDAPRDGTIIIVKFREFNAKDGKIAVQAAQWFCDGQGENWGWKKPWHTGIIAHADVWMLPQDFQRLGERAPAESVEFDL
jgi:hypothetical protein